MQAAAVSGERAAAAVVERTPAATEAAPTIEAPAVPLLARRPPPISRRSLPHLQRTLGNRQVQRLLQPAGAVCQRCGGRACSCGGGGQKAEREEVARTPLGGGAAAGVARSPAAVLDRLLQRKPENEAALSAIQGYAMYGLLPALKTLATTNPDAAGDEEAGSFVGGPRLVTAMRAAKAGGTWLDFIAANNAGVAALPNDQIADIMSFLGAPKDARYFKADELGGKYDGSVDPAGGLITLYFRVKLELAPVRINGAEPGTPAWQAEATKLGEIIKNKFAPEFKTAVEAQWSGKGMVKPACAVGKLKGFQTKVVVTPVDGGEHATFFIHPAGSSGRSNMGKEGFGNLKADDNTPHTSTSQVSDPTGKRPVQVTTTQTTSTHEFGHAIGLPHVRCEGSESICYGATEEERQDVMGAGNKLQVIKRAGKVVHDDFLAFERIGERWGKDIFPGALAKCNVWSAST